MTSRDTLWRKVQSVIECATPLLAATVLGYILVRAGAWWLLATDAVVLGVGFAVHAVAERLRIRRWIKAFRDDPLVNWRPIALAPRAGDRDDR